MSKKRINPATTRNPYNRLFGFVTVAGILQPVRCSGVAEGDIDSIKAPGFYEYRPTSVTGNVPSVGWGNMIVVAGGSYMRTQIVFGKSKAAYRNYDSEWSSWLYLS